MAKKSWQLAIGKEKLASSLFVNLKQLEHDDHKILQN
jgi:hypothetical protein